MKHVSVVYNEFSKRHDGSLACWVEEDRNTVLQQAFKFKHIWEGSGYGPYRILSGTLKEEIVLPHRFRTKPIKEERPERSKRGRKRHS